MKRKLEPWRPTEAISAKAGFLYLLPIAVIPVMQMIGTVWPGYATWGFNYWALFGRLVSLAILAVVLIVIFSPINPFLNRLLTGRLGDDRPRRRLAGRYFAYGVISIILLGIFFFFRSRALTYGDGYTILGFYKPGTEGGIGGQHLLQLLSVALYRLTLPVMVNSLGLPLKESFAVVNCIGGVAAFWAVYAICGRLTQSTNIRILLLLASFTSGAVILFFGYIETYTWALAAALWSAHFTLLYVEGRTGPWPALVMALVAFGFHMITLPFAAATLLAIILCRRGKDRSPRLALEPAWLSLGIIVISSISALAVFYLDRWGVLSIENIVVAPIPQPDNSYWLLSADHLLDFFNLMVLISPLGLVLLPFLIFNRRTETALRDVRNLFMATLSLVAILLAFWIDPHLGMVRDWDLLSFFGLPFTLWAVLTFTLTVSPKAVDRILLVPVIMAVIITVGPNLYEKNNPDVSLSRLDALIWQCPHYQPSYDDAMRCLTWGDLMRFAEKRDDLAVKYIKRRLDAEIKTPSAWSNLAYIYTHQNRLDSASYCFRMAVSLWPENAAYWQKLAYIEQKRGNFKDALAFISQAEKIKPDDSLIITQKGLVLFKLGRVEEADACIRRARHLDPKPAVESGKTKEEANGR